MDNNKAFVAVLSDIKPIEGADKIVLSSVLLNNVPITNVIVGKDTIDGEKIVYFDSNMCLEPSTIVERYPDLGKYLSKKGRVRTIKLKGVYSDGLCVPVEKFEPFFKNRRSFEETMVEGYSFTDIEKTHICHKYEPPPAKVPSPSKNSNKNKGKVISKVIPGQFRFHIDTEQLVRNIHKLYPTDVISITRKQHGSSSITSYTLVKRKLSVIDRIAKLLGAKVVESEYDYLYSSRRVIKNESLNPGFYKTDIWTEAGKQIQTGMKQGETIYYEIVGYLSSGSPIQKGFNYGLLPGENKILVYRITKTSPDGHVTEYGWQAVKDRCKELGLASVEEFYFGRAMDLYPCSSLEEEDVDSWRIEFLEYLKGAYLNRLVHENLGQKVPDEGIVLRKESGDIEVFKLKDMAFLAFETKANEKEEDNIEESN